MLWRAHVARLRSEALSPNSPHTSVFEGIEEHLRSPKTAWISREHPFPTHCKAVYTGSIPVVALKNACK
jgi:hypothetical protein